MENNQLKAIVMAQLSPGFTSRAMNKIELDILDANAQLILDKCIPAGATNG